MSVGELNRKLARAKWELEHQRELMIGEMNEIKCHAFKEHKDCEDNIARMQEELESRSSSGAAQVRKFQQELENSNWQVIGEK